MKIVKGCLMLLLVSGLLFAREFVVLEFRELSSDFKAQTDPELDMDMNYCAVLRVESTRAVDISLLEKTYRTEKIASGKFYFYISSREKAITLQSAAYDDLKVDAPSRGFKAGTVYFLRLDTRDDVDVTINVTPEDAIIRVNGKRWINPTSKLVPGVHDLEISMEGYQIIRGKLRIDNRPATFNYSLSEIAAPPPPPVSTPSSSASASGFSTLPVVEGYDVRFQLQSCKRMPDGKVVIKIQVMNLSPDDQDLNFIGKTRFFDDQGREFPASLRQIGNKSSAYYHLEHRLISGVTTVFTLTFNDIPRSSQSISLLEIATADWTLPLRNIAIE
ncbi:MAG TPA: hypothetical protein ENO01_01500 [Candidatus Marinimicrobia bacterium]|nr:hypothetical protein [Candidatus Neomarinimicrobiota bacterium]